MLEKVAKAICVVDNERLERSLPCACDGKTMERGRPCPYREEARAAIEAMREPSEEMIEAGRRHERFTLAKEGVAPRWQAMIDKALEE